MENPSPNPVSRQGLMLMLETARQGGKEIPELYSIMSHEVQRIIDNQGLPYRIEGYKVRDVSESTEGFLDLFITVDPAMLSVKDTVRKIAPTHHPVLITGPTGTGKELIARALHGDRSNVVKHRQRNDSTPLPRFVALNCAGLNDELVESELFGHKRGSFTGAHQDKKGLMEVAGNGTLFLDEVGDLSLQAQSKLLRAIQEKSIRRVGDDKEIEISCRIVCATNIDIRGLCESKLFRKDLYARLSTFEIFLTGLDMRRCDIIPILESLENGAELVKKLNESNSLEAVDVSLNVRSLQKRMIQFNVLGI